MSSELDPVLHNIYEAAHCTVVLYSQDGTAVFRRIPRGGEDISLSDPELFIQIMHYLKQSSRPLMMSEDTVVGGYRFPDGRILVVGPVRGKDRSIRKGDRMKIVNAMLSNIAWFAARLFRSIMQEREPFFGRAYIDELAPLKSTLPDWSEVVMEDNSHRSYAYELAGLDAVSRGDIQRAKECSAETYPPENGQDGTLGYTALRHQQNLSLCSIVLGSRAAIAGGVSVERAYTMADYLILATESCTSVRDAEFIGRKAGVIFASMVKDVNINLPAAQRTQRILTVRASELVRRSIYKEVSRLDLASELNINADHLDRVMKEDINLTLMGCLRKERLKEAAALLVGSKLQIGVISEMLCFNSTAYFCRVFKEEFSVSPGEYRRKILQSGSNKREK